MSLLQNLMSFLHPVIIDSKPGKISKLLEVTKSNGKFVLNTATTNYSYGGINTMFDDFFKKINIKKFEIQNILILGMGAGNMIALLREKYGIESPITAIEKDPVVIELAHKYFNIARFKNLTIVEADAFDYCKESLDKFDLVLIDLFIDGDVPAIFASKEFLTNLRKVMTDKSCLIYNKMTEQPHHKKEFDQLLLEISKHSPSTTIHTSNSHESENSFIYFNTLSLIGQGKIKNKHI